MLIVNYLHATDRPTDMDDDIFYFITGQVLDVDDDILRLRIIVD